MVGAIFSCALQVGCAAGAAIITSIQTSVQENHGGPNSFTGRAAGFWFLFAVVCSLTAGVFVFMRNTLPPVKKNKADCNRFGREACWCVPTVRCVGPANSDGEPCQFLSTCEAR